MKVRYRLGLDLGTNSLGWAVINLDEQDQPSGLRRLGVRIFSDGRNPKDGTSNAVARRMARQMRRRRDRFLNRRNRLVALMVEHGLMPADPAERKKLSALDPYALRRRGLDARLPLHELGRAIFHLHQRRGFLSNRRVDRTAKDDEKGKIRNALSRVAQSITEDGSRTVGEWLARRRDKREPVRARLRGRGAKATYELYVSRDMIAAEFDALWAAQSALQASPLPEEARARIRDALLFQRRLRPVKPGRCLFETHEERAPWALASLQRFRILQELNHLRIVSDDLRARTLTRAERDTLYEAFERSAKVTFSRMRKLLGLSRGESFNLESEKRPYLTGNIVSVAMSRDEYVGSAWHKLSEQQQDAMVEQLLQSDQEDALIEWLIDTYGLAQSSATRMVDMPLPDGYASVGRTAVSRILKHLRDDVVPYSEAAQRAGYHHSDFYDGEIHAALPYYGKALQRQVGFGTGDPGDPDELRYGRIANPTVHIGLNQTRRIVNALIRRYGPPTEVVIEVARDLKNGRERRKEIEAEQKQRQEQNDKFRQELAELGLPPNALNVLKLRLWTELNTEDPLSRRCPFTGEQISRARLFSEEVEIEHLLPFARTLDDSPANKTVSLRRANRDKGNRSPFEAFGHSPAGYDWASILARGMAMPRNKRWRFAEDAMARYEGERDFLARHLNDTAYMSRIAREYLTLICVPHRVWAVPGQLTSLLRGRWGLNQLLSGTGTKNRSDHRHHALDAVVIAVSDRAILQRVSDAAQSARARHVGRILEEMPLPWPGFREAVHQSLEKVIVSYKPDHDPSAALHNDTAYGLVGERDEDGRFTVVHRVALGSLASDSDIEKVRDPLLRERLSAATAGKTKKDFSDVLQRLEAETGIRHVRVVERLSVIPVSRNDGHSPYKALKGDSNYCIEIYRTPQGKWRDRVVSTFEANKIARLDAARLRNRKSALGGEPLVMRLCVNDTIATQSETAERTIWRVVKLSSGRVTFAQHLEGGSLKERDSDKSDPFKYFTASASSLQKNSARQVKVDELGYVLDPGFKP
jgi:CRISPR-associated endonuclease Csn1